MRSGTVIAFAALAAMGFAMPLRRKRDAQPAEALAASQHDAREAISAQERARRARLVPDYIAAARAVYKTPHDAFNATDTNQDGRLRVAEWNAESTKLKLDVTTTEAIAPGWTAFQEMDVDNDSFVSLDEFYRAVAKPGMITEWKEPAPAAPTSPPYNDTDYKHDDTPLYRSGTVGAGSVGAALAVTSVLALIA